MQSDNSIDYRQRVSLIGKAASRVLAQYAPPPHLRAGEAREDFMADLVDGLNQIIPTRINREQMDLALVDMRRSVVGNHKYQRWPSVAEIIEWTRPDVVRHAQRNDGGTTQAIQPPSTVRPITAEDIVRNNAWLESNPMERTPMGAKLQSALLSLRKSMRTAGADV